MFWLSFAAMFAMARAPHCCPSSVPLVSIAVRPDSWVWGSMISELKIPRGAGLHERRRRHCHGRSRAINSRVNLERLCCIYLREPQDSWRWFARFAADTTGC